MARNPRSFVVSLILAMVFAIPGPVWASTTTRSFPKIPWNGIKIDLSATGNFVFGGQSTYPNGGSQDNYLCSADGGPITSMDLSGTVWFELPAYDGTFVYMDVTATAFYYPPGQKVPIEVYKDRTVINAPGPLPIIPFSISGNLPIGDRIAFNVTAVYCEEFKDRVPPSNACYPLIYSAVSYEYKYGPAPCFIIEKTTPEDYAKNIDFDQPGITVTFNSPVDEDTVNSETFQVYYWDKNMNKAFVDGSFNFSADSKTVNFVPDEGLLDGVYYEVQVWGETEARAFQRSEWIKGANETPLVDGKTWTFWTMPDLTDRIEIVPVQSVENVDLIKGKPTLIKVFMRWEKKPQVHPKRQLKTLDADVSIYWWENNHGDSDTWSSTGRRGKRWTPLYGTPIKQEYRVYTTADESYTKREKTFAQDSINYYGFKPSAIGTVTFSAQVKPLGQPKTNPRVFISKHVDRSIRETKKFRYAYIPVNIGNWTATGNVISCSPPVPPGTTCVNIQAMADGNHSMLQALYPLAPGRAIRNRGLSNFHLIDPPARLALNPVKAAQSDWRKLLHWLSRGAEASSTWDAYVGVLPHAWLGLNGVTFTETWFGYDYARHSALVAHDADELIVSHEFGHMLRDWGDYKNSYLEADEGFYLQARVDKRNSVNRLEGPPHTLPIYHLMYVDPVASGREIWIDESQFRQLYTNELAESPSNSFLGNGDPLLLVSGTINTSNNQVIAEPWYQTESAHWTPQTSGSHTVEFLNHSGARLADYFFSPTPPLDGISHFLTKIPLHPETKKIRLLAGSLPIYEKEASPNTPQTTIIAPVSGAVWSGVQNIQWTGSDLDGDMVYYGLSFSFDGGTSWQPLELDMTTSPYLLNTRQFPNSSQCLLKITASDGLNSSIRISEVFSISNPPTATKLYPTPGQTGVTVGSPILVEFSEAMDPATIQGETFFLKDPLNQTVHGEISYDAENFQAQFFPSEPLTYSGNYRASITTGMKNQQGSALESGVIWSFTTEPNVYPPQVVHFSPSERENDASLNATLVAVRFDKPMDPATFTSQSFSVRPPSGSAVAGQIIYVPGTYTALFYPAVNWTPQTRYTVTLTTAVLDSDGNPLADPFSWSFRTGTENTGWVRFTRNLLDYTVDQDGDGLWDNLVIDVEVSVLFTSTYSLKGRLLDKNGRFIAHAATGNLSLTPGVHVLSLSFSRQDIQAHGVEGPYYFADGYLVDLSYPSSNAMLATPYLTHFNNFTVDADLMLFAYPDPGVYHQPLTFYASVENQGSSSADGVVVTVTLPPTVEFVSASSGQGNCSHSAGTVTCTIGTLGSGQSNLVAIVITPREKGWVQFQASVVSVQDSYVANNNQQLALEIGSGNNVLYLPLVMKP